MHTILLAKAIEADIARDTVRRSRFAEIRRRRQARRRHIEQGSTLHRNEMLWTWRHESQARGS